MIRSFLGLSLVLLLGCPSSDTGTKDTSVVNGGGGGDEDGDGYKPTEGDCDETNPDINPGAPEICDGLDNNCDGIIDEGVMGTFYADADGDGFGDLDVPMEACEAPAGYVTNSEDCDDAQALSFPGNVEVCDEIDNDCDGVIDNGVGDVYYADGDEDGYGDAGAPQQACSQPAGMVLDNTDCDDTTNKAFPGNTEVCDTIDNNCDGVVDEGVETTYYADVDSDGYGDPSLILMACSLPAGYSADNTDCDDARYETNPGAIEYCNGYDDNCDGVIDEDTADDAMTWYADNDTDGYGDPSTGVVSCSAPPGYVSDNTDCDDTRARSNPAGIELCNGYDDNCDGTVDEATAVDASTWYYDADSDAYGNPSVSTVACSAPAGYVADNTDCNDGTSLANPGQLEVCDGIDNDCDGTSDEPDAIDASTWYADADSDNYGDASVSQPACTQPAGYVADATDCDDARYETNPGATEYCNGYDDDCDGVVDEADAVDSQTWYADADSDLYGNPSVSTVQCDQPAGYVTDNTDCDDTVSTTNPGGTEVCNGVDDDCNGTVDDDYATDATTWYADSDSDTYGNASVSQVDCLQPAGYVVDSTDCNDTTAAAYPGADEVCDGIDNDCDGDIDEDGGVSDGDTYYMDADSDTYGDESTTIEACSLPSGYVENYYDCDDTDPSEPVAVDDSGSPSGAGTSADPLDTIQAGIDLADSCVVVTEGHYNEYDIDFGGKTLDVWGVDGRDVTTIDPGLTVCDYTNPTDCHPVFLLNSGTGAAPTIHGFWVTGGTGYLTETTTTETCADSDPSHASADTCTVTQDDFCGGGAYVSGDDPQFSDMVFEAGDLPEFAQEPTGSWSQAWVSSAGGGVCALNSAATFDNVVFSSNFADSGGGLYVGASSTVEVVHGWFDDNSASDGGGIATDTSDLNVSNTVIACNSATVDGGGSFSDTSGSVNFTNILFAMNTSGTATTNGSQTYSGSSVTLMLWNMVAQANTTSPMFYNLGTASIGYADSYNAGGGGTTSGTWSAMSVTSSGSQYTNISCDGNWQNDDASLVAGAASINAGDPSILDADGSRSDLGAYGGPEGTW
ncbi:hypothetical protein LBMAG42_05810 [Deltaproteobacteria bacterium]|nr:hypothetical protein LBMAG42_05810 [Deltaproteobacteria bacterium]